MQTLARENRCTIMIQSVVRGFIARRWVAVWKVKRAHTIVWCQACIRRRLTGKKWRLQCETEKIAATQCQSLIRRFLAKCFAYRSRRIAASSRIQKSWRISKSRMICKIQREDVNATIIQCFGRKEILTKSRYKNIREDKHDAARRIASCWRGHCSRLVRDELLHKRDIKQRSNQVRILTSEHQHWNDQIALLQRRIEKSKPIHSAVKSIHEIRNDMAKLQAKIIENENNLVEQSRIHERMSPRSVEQGWQAQVEKNIDSARQAITKTKIDFLFNTKQKLRGLEENFEKSIEEMDRLKAKNGWYLKWRQEELERLWECQRRHHYKEKQKRQRQSIADERRKWEKIITRPSGKPEKLRRRKSEQQRLSPTSQNTYSTVSNIPFCSGAVDLLAFDPNINSQDTKADRLVRMGEYCSYQNQLQLYESLFEPIAKIMQKERNCIERSVNPTIGGLQPAESVGSCEKSNDKNNTNTKNKKTNQERQNAEHSTRHFKSGKGRKNAGCQLPWSLLDEVQAEKEKFALEKSLMLMMKGK
mmetsp:Transcript_35516/g.51887  ORF Transcript_35516/g.51887 Transcript_35516/m.51887 type:complete len:531 (+) Transcript_35516:935-2527(+)